ncbi:MAG: hypothetical protein WD048_01285 [Chitinophagales bacterium]
MNKRIFTVSVLVSVIAIASLFSAYVAAPQSQEKDVVTIRINDHIIKKSSAIYVVEGGESRIVDLERYDIRDSENFRTLSKVIEEYIKKGYSIESATSVSFNGGGTSQAIVHDYVLVK